MERNICFLCTLSSSSTSRFHFCRSDGRARVRLHPPEHFSSSGLQAFAHAALPSGMSSLCPLQLLKPGLLLQTFSSQSALLSPGQHLYLPFPFVIQHLLSLLPFCVQAVPGESHVWSSQRTCQSEARVNSKVQLKPKCPSLLVFSLTTLVCDSFYPISQ